MEIRNWLVSGCLLVAVPMWIGGIWAYFAEFTGWIKKLLFCWVSGFITVMAVSQVILVPLVLRRRSFLEYQWLASILYAGLMIAALVLWIKKRKQRKDREEKSPEKEKVNVWQALFLTGALGLIFIQAFIAGNYQHIDDDDSRFVVEQVLAVEHGAMYTENPVTGALSYWDMGEVRKDMISPWAMLVAYWCKLSGIAPAIMSHKYLPFFLILLCYAVYALTAMHFFGKDREKIGIFLLFVSMLNIFGYFSTHTVPAVMLLRIWQGKALVGAFLLPALCYIMFEIMSQGSRMWYLLAAACATAAALASGSGITTVPVLIAAFGAAELIHGRKIKKTILIWCTAIPSAVYLFCYLFFWQLLKVYF